MVEATDQDIEAARILAGYAVSVTPQAVRYHNHNNMMWAKRLLAHARTLAELRIVTEALGHCAECDPESAMFAASALAQIKEAPHA